MTSGTQTDIRERWAAMLSALAVSAPAFVGACTGCLGVAASAAVVAPFTGLGAAWQMLAVVGVSATVASVSPSQRNAPKSSRLIGIGRAATSGALIYFEVVGILTIVGALSADQTGGAPSLP